MNETQPFYLDEYLEQYGQSLKPVRVIKNTASQLERFEQVCTTVMEAFNHEWEVEEGKSEDAADKLLERQKKAIIGYSTEVNFFKGKTEDYLKKNSLVNEWFPKWYPDLVTAIFEENWGTAGMYPWKYQMPDSSSAKIVGERIYFLEGGHSVLQTQRISNSRLNQLITALLIRTPQKRRDSDTHEVYMLDGTRITIYEETIAKEPVIVFRKYSVNVYTFEKQVELHTIPGELVPVLKSMVQIGYNVAFCGPVRSAKTTFLTTYQMYEDPSLEGVMVETDPEIPLHVLMPQAPVMQLIADGEKLGKIVKSLMRSDGDYLVMAEARDGIALKIALDVTKKGTRRVKMTYHTSDAVDFCYDVATDITQQYGGDVWATTIKVAKGYHYLFEFVQLQDKSQKRLKGLYEIRYDPKSMNVYVVLLCQYDYATDAWRYNFSVGADKIRIAQEENLEAYKIFSAELQRLAGEKPILGDTEFELPYLKLLNR